jgi:hypothetical protein
MPHFIVTAIFRILSISRLNYEYVLRNAFPTAGQACKAFSLPVKSPPDITERREVIPVAPVEFSVTAVLLALIILWIVYSVMGWWT